MQINKTEVFGGNQPSTIAEKTKEHKRERRRMATSIFCSLLQCEHDELVHFSTSQRNDYLINRAILLTDKLMRGLDEHAD